MPGANHVGTQFLFWGPRFFKPMGSQDPVFLCPSANTATWMVKKLDSLWHIIFSRSITLYFRPDVHIFLYTYIYIYMKCVISIVHNKNKTWKYPFTLYIVQRCRKYYWTSEQCCPWTWIFCIHTTLTSFMFQQCRVWSQCKQFCWNSEYTSTQRILQK